MPKKQQGQVVHGGKDYERAARKEEARKKKEAEQNAKHELYLKGRAMVLKLQAKLQEARVFFKTACPNELDDDAESADPWYSDEESADEGIPCLKQLSRRAAKIEDLYEKHFQTKLVTRVKDLIPTVTPAKSIQQIIALQQKNKTKEEYLALKENNRLLHEQILLGLELEAAETATAEKANKNEDPTKISAKPDSAKTDTDKALV